MNDSPLGFEDNGADIEARLLHDAEHLNCPRCGGSGHVEDADSRVSALMEKVAEYRRGNTALLDAVMRLMDGQPRAPGRAYALLRDARMLLPEGGMNWSALAEREQNEWTWRTAVKMLVSEPGEQQRLLALDDRRIDVAAEARELVATATRQGQVLTVEQVPLTPLAMGHHETIVTVREAR